MRFPALQPLAARAGGLTLSGLSLVAAIAAVLVSLQFSDDWICALINAALFALPFLLVSALSGRAAVAGAVAIALALLLWAVGEFKLRYFGDRLSVLDFYFLSEAANWSIVQRYPRVQAALIGWLLLCALLGWQAWREERQRRRLGWRGRLLCGLLLVAWCGFLWAHRHQHQWQVFRDDAECGTNSTCGVLSRLLFSTSVLEFSPPLPRSDPTLFVARAAELDETDAAAPAGDTGTTHPDVVVWLNESTLNPAQYRLPRARLPALPMFRDGRYTRAGGLLRVHTFGGKTWLSEFSLLTGLVPDDFGVRRNLVFNSVAPQMQSQLVRRFRDNGYATVVLMPTRKQFYGAGRTYEALGFERILTLRDFPEYDRVPGDEWDIADSERLGEAAVKLIREHRAGPDRARPLLMYLLSIKEHAPYAKSMKVEFSLDRAGIKSSLAGKLTDYVQRLQLLDRAATALERELVLGGRPAVWCWFGDHQAYFEENPPAYRHALPQPELITQYQLRSNFTPKVSDLAALAEPIDIAALPSLLTDTAGLPRDAYFEAQTAMRRLCQGRLEDCPDTALLDSYKGLLFGADLALFGDAGPEAAIQLK